MIKKYLAEVINIDNRVEGIYTVDLISLTVPFKYHPGQFLHLALDEYDPSGQWPESRCFSMQSAPGKELIRITYAVKGIFTSRMQQELKPGKQVTMKLPYGDLFMKPHKKMNNVFIAGGTGITPFLSLFTHESFKEYTNPRIYLGFRSKKYNIYDSELSFSLKSHTLLNIFYEDIEGSLDICKIFSKNGTNSDYFISGPPDMIKSFKQTLIAKRVPINQVLTDEWE